MEGEARVLAGCNRAFGEQKIRADAKYLQIIVTTVGVVSGVWEQLHAGGVSTVRSALKQSVLRSL